MTFDASETPDAERRGQPYFVGVEVGRSLLRAGVFAEGRQLLGKTKLSTKLERGPDVVFDRIFRCIQYAIDECDLTIDQIQAVGVGIGGWVDEPEGVLRKSSDLGWEQVPLGPRLEERLSIPVAVANRYDLAALGIWTHELEAAPRSSVLSLFLGAEIGVSFLQKGHWTPLRNSPEALDFLEAPNENVCRTFNVPEFRHFRNRDFRKALRKGNRAAETFLNHVSDAAGEFAAELIRKLQPDVVAIGGGAIDDVREVALSRMQTRATALLPPIPTPTTWLASHLGDAATIAGAACWASQLSRQPVAT